MALSELAHVGWLALCVLLLYHFLRERGTRTYRPVLRRRWPVRSVTIDQFDPTFTPGPFGPGLETEVSFIGRGSLVVTGGTTDAEAWILAVLSKRARLLFEFGTCTGKTTYLWARNSPPDARIVTITLAPGEAGAYQTGAGDDRRATTVALRESAFSKFLYSGTEAAAKIEQLFGDSKSLDVTPWAGRCDLVFVDGSHAYSYVLSDSAKALELVRPGGVVLWHDYAGPHQSPGVRRALDELARQLPLAHIAQTSLVAYRRG